MYGDGFLEGALGEAQNNLSGFISSMAPSRGSESTFHPTDNNWGIQGFNGSDSWGIPGFSGSDSWGIPGYGGTDNFSLIPNLAQLSSPAPPPRAPGIPTGKPSTAAPTGPSSAVPVAKDSPYYGTAQQAARNSGYDPDMFTSQIAVESGFQIGRVSPKGARGIAQIMPQYHPGVNPDDPEAALNYAARLMAQYSKEFGGDPRWALAAYNMGEGAFRQIWQQTNGRPDVSMLPGETQKYINDVMATNAKQHAGLTITPGYAGPQAPPPQDPASPNVGPRQYGQWNAQTLVPDQYHEGLAAGYDKETALAICGPAAAAAFTRAYGHAPATLQDATEAARIKGLWDVATGMHGPESEASLMKYLGVPVHVEQGVDWNKVISQVEAGHPVALSTPTQYGGHYLVATGYDRQTGKFEFGSSASVLIASGGRTQWAPSELGRIGIGTPSASIYMD